MESMCLEHLARERAYDFRFVALPTKIVGTRGSLVDPVAAV